MKDAHELDQLVKAVLSETAHLRVPAISIARKKEDHVGTQHPPPQAPPLSAPSMQSTADHMVIHTQAPPAQTPPPSAPSLQFTASNTDTQSASPLQATIQIMVPAPNHPTAIATPPKGPLLFKFHDMYRNWAMSTGITAPYPDIIQFLESDALQASIMSHWHNKGNIRDDKQRIRMSI